MSFLDAVVCFRSIYAKHPDIRIFLIYQIHLGRTYLKYIREDRLVKIKLSIAKSNFRTVSREYSLIKMSKRCKTEI